MEKGQYTYVLGAGGEYNSVWTLLEGKVSADGGDSYLKISNKEIIKLTGGTRGGNGDYCGAYGTRTINTENIQIDSEKSKGVRGSNIHQGPYKDQGVGGDLGEFTTRTGEIITPGKGGDYQQSGTGGYIKIEYLHQ